MLFFIPNRCEVTPLLFYYDASYVEEQLLATITETYGACKVCCKECNKERKTQYFKFVYFIDFYSTTYQELPANKIINAVTLLVYFILLI